jgi:hypothetical protein
MSKAIVRTISHSSNFSQFSWRFWVVLFCGLGLLGGAVFSTAQVSQLAYESAQLQVEEAQLLARQQLLQEELAQAQSLERIWSYAQETGFLSQAEYNGKLSIAKHFAQVNH